MAKEEYEHKDVPTGKGAHTMSMLTGKHRSAKRGAIRKKMEGVKTSIGKVLRLHKGKE